MIKRTIHFTSKNKKKTLFLAVFIYLTLGTLANIFFMKSESIELSIWWSIKHLIDPGFIGEDYPATPCPQPISFLEVCEPTIPFTYGIIGVFFSIFGLVLFVVIFIEMIRKNAERFIDESKNGYWPSQIRDHAIIIGTYNRINQLVRDQVNIKDKLCNTYRVSDILLIIDGSVDEYQSLKIDHIYSYRSSIEELNKNTDHFNLANAKEIILISDNNLCLDEIILLLNKATEKRSYNKKNKLLKITIEINSSEMELALHRVFSSNHLNDLNIHLRFVYINNLKAQLILKHIPLDGRSTVRLGQKQHAIVVILGWSTLARALIEQIRSSGLYNSEPTQIFRISLNKNDIIDFQKEFPPPEPNDTYQAYLKTFDIQNISTDMLRDILVAGTQNREISQITVLSSGSLPNKVFQQAIEWETSLTSYYIKEQLTIRNTLVEKLQIILELPDNSIFRNIVEMEPSFKHFKVTVTDRETLSHIGEIDELPRKAHEHYLKMLDEWGERYRLPDGRYELASHNDWALLPYTCQNWNRSTVAHIEVKLRLIANEYQLPHPLFTLDGRLSYIDSTLSEHLREMIEEFNMTKEFDEQSYAETLQRSAQLQLLERLAELEHDRWSSERYIQGWRYSPKRHDNLRHHPSLIFYKNLGYKEKIKDRDNIISQFKNILNS